MKQPPHSFQRALLAVATLALAGAGSSQAQLSNSLQRVSPALATANDLGAMSPNQPVTLSVHLVGDKAELDAAVARLYDPASPQFHKWLTDEDLKRYAPTDAQVAIVRKELESHGLRVVSAGTDNFSLQVTGTVAGAEAAFNTQLRQFSKGASTFRANTVGARLNGEAQQYVSSVAGLESHTIQPMFKRAVNINTGQPYPAIPLPKVNSLPALAGVITDVALTGPTTFYLQTPGASLPVALYYGNQYNADPKRSVAFTAPQLQGAYGLTDAYKQGLDGTGQTIVLLEAYGDSYIESDANAFNKLNGLPLLSPTNFSVVYPEGQPKNQDTVATLTGWDVEIALDVEWAHAIAPGAKIVVVAAAGQDSQDFQDAISYITRNKTGYTVSDSWEDDLDLIAGPVEQQAFEDVLELAAAKGISFQFSTGDGGDSGLGTPVGAPGVPSAAPHATAVGGTAILNNVNGSGFLPVGWGDTLAVLSADGVVDPPLLDGLIGGAGGGESSYFAKPSWQAALPGTGRQTPDVSALADPYTGVPVVVTLNGVQELIPGVGGTSLASPIFTAFWAIAQQKAGGPLGQAAPLVASLPRGGVQDVLPLSSPTSPVGAILDAKGATYYTPSQIFAGGTDGATGFTSAVWNLSSPKVPYYYDFGFGLDGSLTVGPGWDNVTGYGTPYGLTFIQAVAKAAAAAK